MDLSVIGWDIGGVNTKVARVSTGAVLARARPYELQRDPEALVPLLGELAAAVGGRRSDLHAVTMTAELSQYFRTKREGVHFVLDAMAAAFPGGDIRVFAVEGSFLDLGVARRAAVAVAASNWAATALLVARSVPAGVVIDVGTTTTDVVPLAGGRVVAQGLTDPDRLRSGELLYLGAVRTPIEAIVHQVPLRGAMAGVSAEGFALSGDVHLWRGALAPECYAAPTPDGRPATREFAGERLARVVCADREWLSDDEITAIADYIADAQVARIAGTLRRVKDRRPDAATAVVTGLGGFLAAAAARRAGFHVSPLPDTLGGVPAQCSAAAAAALLLAATTRA